MLEDEEEERAGNGPGERRSEGTPKRPSGMEKDEGSERPRRSKADQEGEKGVLL